MKVAVSSTGNDLTSQIDPRFGRCKCFVIVETNDMRFDAFENENAVLSGSAGIQSASFVASQGVKAVLTGNCGPKAAQVLSAADIEIYVGQTGTVRDAVEKYKKGFLVSAADGNVSEKFGAGGSGSMQNSGKPIFSRKMGMCGGRGMGMGGGKGMGRGIGMPPADREASGDLSKEKELKLLQEQARELKKQMENIESRIKNLK